MKWLCTCGHENDDDPEQTALPICGLCELDWEELGWKWGFLDLEDAQRQGRLIA